MSRIQKLAQPLWIGNISINNKNFYVHWMEKEGLKYAKVPNKEAAKAFIERCVARNVGGYASGPIPCNNNQHGVFMYAQAGFTKECAMRKNDNEKVNKAYKSVFAVVETQPKQQEEAFQKIATKDKDDPMRMIVIVNYPGSGKPYTFRCRKWHTPGDRVCVHTNDKYTNVTVVECKTMKESEVKALAKHIGYEDISEVYCDNAIDDNVEEEYEENIDELRAMKEAFEPACDYVANPNPDGYTFDDLDDLPE